jgi:hypothetical protein
MKGGHTYTPYTLKATYTYNVNLLAMAEYHLAMVSIRVQSPATGMRMPTYWFFQ